MVGNGLGAFVMVDFPPSRGNSGGWWILGTAGALVVVTCLVAVFGPVPTVREENAAAMLTLIAAGAIGIERVLEIFWVAMGLNGRPWWPFTSIGYRVQESISSLNETLIPFRNQVSEVVGQVEEGASDMAEAVQDAAASSQRQQIDQLIRELETLGPDNRRAREVAAAASGIAEFFENNYERLTDTAASVQSSVGVVNKVLDSFKDNPARRAFSICLGGLIGVVAAWALGLDALQATGVTPPDIVGIFPNAGTAITGVVIGLGASPTHELVKTLQETKQERRSP